MEISNVFLHRNRFGEMLHCVTCLPVVNGCHQNMSPNSKKKHTNNIQVTHMTPVKLSLVK